MSGNNLVLQARDRRLLEELAVMRIADRDQAMLAVGFRSASRANARLLALTRAGLLRRYFQGSSAAGRKALYALSAKGAKLIGTSVRGPRRKSGASLVADSFVTHQLAVNEIYCAVKFGPLPEGIGFRRWSPFFAALANTKLIPDGYVELSTPDGALAAFLEIDLGHESAAIWNRKVRAYLDYALSGRYQREFGQKSFRVLVIANTERRLRFLRAATSAATQKLFWFADLPTIRAQGLFASAWMRPRPCQTIRLLS